jgi:hypothetical protein
MVLTASALRRDIYRTLDRVAESGIPVEVLHKKRRVRIVPVERKSRLANLRKRSIMRCAPEELVHIDWSGAELGPPALGSGSGSQSRPRIVRMPRMERVRVLRAHAAADGTCS